VWSNFQSPECTIVPWAVSIVTPTASGMLWQT